MEGDAAGEAWEPSHIMLTGWVTWDRKLETTMDSALARRMLTEILDGLPTHRRALIGEESTLGDSSERVHHMKVMIKSSAWERRI